MGDPDQDSRCNWWNMGGVHRVSESSDPSPLSGLNGEKMSQYVTYCDSSMPRYALRIDWNFEIPVPYPVLYSTNNTNSIGDIGSSHSPKKNSTVEHNTRIHTNYVVFSSPQGPGFRASATTDNASIMVDLTKVDITNNIFQRGGPICTAVTGPSAIPVGWWKDLKRRDQSTPELCKWLG